LKYKCIEELFLKVRMNTKMFESIQCLCSRIEEKSSDHVSSKTTNNDQKKVMYNDPDEGTWAWNRIYLCTKEKSELIRYSCSPYESFEQADSYYKRNHESGTLSTMVSLPRLLPQSFHQRALEHKLMNTFIKVNIK
jgi:hypothetical protein